MPNLHGYSTGAPVDQFDALDEGIALFEQYFTSARDHTDSANRDRERAKSNRVKAALVLIELRRRVEAGDEDAGGLTWWQWAEKNIKRSRRDIAKLLKIGGAPDPEAEAEAERAKNARAAKKSRDNKKTGADVSPSGATPGPGHNSAAVARMGIAAAVDFMAAMTDAQWQEFCAMLPDAVKLKLKSMLEPATDSPPSEAPAAAPEPQTKRERPQLKSTKATH